MSRIQSSENALYVRRQQTDLETLEFEVRSITAVFVGGSDMGGINHGFKGLPPDSPGQIIILGGF